MATNQSAFDPNVFLNQEVKGSSETKYTPIPVDEYHAFIDELGMDSYEGQPILLVTYAIIGEKGDKLKETLGLEKPTVRDSIFLDVADDGFTLLFGPNKNVKLGRLREACDQNNPKVKWNFNMLRGVGPLLIMVEHNTNKKGEGPFANVARVARVPSA